MILENPSCHKVKLIINGEELIIKEGLGGIEYETCSY